MIKEIPRKLAVTEIAAAVVETVYECRHEGTPAGLLYVALMQWGLSHETFERFMQVLSDKAMVIKRGHLYFPGDMGIAWVEARKEK